MVIKWILNLITAYSFIDSASFIELNLNHPIWSLHIWCCTHIPHGWLAQPIMRDQRRFSLTSAFHVLLVKWDHFAIIQNHLPFEGTPINTTGFQNVGPTFIRSELFFFSTHSSSVHHASLYLGFPHFGHIITHQKPPPFPNLWLLWATLISCIVSMGLSQRALIEVLVVPCWLPLPLIQGCFWSRFSII